MKFEYEPLTEEEWDEFGLWPAGKYRFQTIKTEDTLSNAGDCQIKLYNKIWNSKGEERVIYDWLNPKFIIKVKHYCDATGLEHEYQNKLFNSSLCQNKEGWLDLIIEPRKLKKNSNDYWPSKNAVKDYLVMKPGGGIGAIPYVNLAPIAIGEISNKELDDDLPF